MILRLTYNVFINTQKRISMTVQNIYYAIMVNMLKRHVIMVINTTLKLGFKIGIILNFKNLLRIKFDI